jgi:hypothetical protein
MLYMIIEHFRPGQAPAVYRRFREHGRMMPEDVRYHASWVDLEFERCFQVMEAESEARLREMDHALGRRSIRGAKTI